MKELKIIGRSALTGFYMAVGFFFGFLILDAVHDFVRAFFS